jgi:hypothetical protein
MKTLWTALLLLTVQLFTAQENEVYADGVFNFTENKNQKIFTDWTRVRKEPGVNGQILDSLQSNQQIMILKKEESVPVLQLGERRANWYKISYQKGETIGEGYIWGGNLCVGYRNKNGYDFLFGLSKTVDRKNNSLNEIVKQNIAGIKVMEGNTLIEEIYFDTGKGEELSTASFTIESNHKLQDIEFTLKAMVSGKLAVLELMTNTSFIRIRNSLPFLS